jgi:hypothetical protein
MNKKELQQRKEQLEAELQKVNEELSKKPTPEEWLLDYLSKGFDKVEVKKDAIVYYRNEQWIFLLDLKKKVLWCYFPEVWERFYEEYDMNYDHVQQLMRDVALKPLNCEGFTPAEKDVPLLVVALKPLNCEGFTPGADMANYRYQALKPLNCEGFTPHP